MRGKVGNPISGGIPNEISKWELYNVGEFEEMSGMVKFFLPLQVALRLKFLSGKVHDKSVTFVEDMMVL